MPDNLHKINELYEKLELLSKKQAQFQREISELRAEIYALRTQEQATPTPIEEKEILPPTPKEKPQPPVKEPSVKRPILASEPLIAQKSNWEKFIGENLINKIGILILVIGVVIGAKYSIDNELISPLTRIILGYLVGLGLIVTAIKLKKDYLNLSAVLLSGAMAVMYFITFSAYSFYQLIPQSLAFGLMVVFTIFTVFAALQYEKAIIAHLGLVGAYAVPFLLSNGSGNVLILFSYVAILNVGILAVALKKYWKSLYISAFVFTWLIFVSWFFTQYQIAQHFSLSLSFLSLFFAIFYAVFLAYKLLQKEAFAPSDIIMVFVNAAMFYGLGYKVIEEHSIGNQVLGLYTLANAIIHFGVSLLIYRQNLADKKLFYLAMSLVLAFLTLAIPVQLEGHWVTLAWTIEAALIFWVGRTRNLPFYEQAAYILMGLATFCLAQDADHHYQWEYWFGKETEIETKSLLRPIFNPQFLSFIVFIASFACINFFNIRYKIAENSPQWQRMLASVAPAALLIAALYSVFYLEISHYYHQLYYTTSIAIPKDGYYDYLTNYSLQDFCSLVLMNYNLVFFSVLAFINLYFFKNRPLAWVTIALLSYSILIFLFNGISLSNHLWRLYFNLEPAGTYHFGLENILIRYVSYLLVGLGLFSIYRTLRESFIQPAPFKTHIPYDVLLFGSGLWILSSELIAQLDRINPNISFKFGLSILWGLYSVFLIVLGIAQKKKHLRLGAIALLAITLLKLFFYDISNLNTIDKTVIFIALGVLLLLISFLYNKYKHLIFDEDEATDK